MTDEELQRLVLQVLPTGLPGRRHMQIARAIQDRTEVKWTHAELRQALAYLERKGLVHSQERADETDRYRIYWRDPSYVAPLDVGVTA